MNLRSHFAFWLLLLTLPVLLVTNRLPSAANDGKSAHADVSGVASVRDLAYLETPQADSVKHKLDLYLPSDRTNFPVMLFVHGGGWAHGDKKFWFDLYGRLGQAFASRGVAVAVTNYRLAPQVKNFDQMRDIARATAWVYRNIANYGGNPGQLFVAGHSAGGHLVSLLAGDNRYLAHENLDTHILRGVISMSGVYDVKPENPLFTMVFGNSVEQRRLASPVTYARPGMPPFLMLHGEHELPYCGDEWAQRFYEKLQQAGVDCQLRTIPKRDHLSIIARISQPNDAALQAILDFIHQHQP
jgi:acetyl esterase/lipase